MELSEENIINRANFFKNYFGLETERFNKMFKNHPPLITYEEEFVKNKSKFYEEWFEYKEGDKFAGIDMEIAKFIADCLELELVIVDMEFDSVVTSVGKNGVDIAMAGLTVNETRKESVNFTSSYYNAAQVVITLEKDNDFKDCKTAEDVLAVIQK